MHVHTFSVTSAIRIGLEPAIVLQHITNNVRKAQFLCQNFYNAHHWATDTWDSLGKEFPYLNDTKLKSILERLTQKSIIRYKTSKTNENEIWYTLVDDILQPTEKPKKRQKKNINASNFHLKLDVELLAKENNLNLSYIRIAYKFWMLWFDDNPKNKTLLNANIEKWYNAIRMIVENDGHDFIRLVGIYKYFEKAARKEPGFEVFWFETLKSTAGLRNRNKDEVYTMDRIMEKVNKKIQASQSFYKEILEEQKLLTQN